LGTNFNTTIHWNDKVSSFSLFAHNSWQITFNTCKTNYFCALTQNMCTRQQTSMEEEDSLNPALAIWLMEELAVL